jgi:hypothetical protein
VRTDELGTLGGHRNDGGRHVVGDDDDVVAGR